MQIQSINVPCLDVLNKDYIRIKGKAHRYLDTLAMTTVKFQEKRH